MAYIFGDSFDLYATIADVVLGYWDSGGANANLVAGRFTGSQALSIFSASVVPLVKTSGVNDSIHHFVCAFRQTATLSGTTLGVYFQLSDGATNQCCVVFRSDGVILLTSATPAGTVLATYTGAVTANNTWYAFEFEVVINNTTGSFAVRKNGSTSNDFSATALNTRPGANAYANKFTVGMLNTITSQQLDDLLWRSDTSSVAWVGDIRCIARMPTAEASTQFSIYPSISQPTWPASGSTSADGTTMCRCQSFTAPFSGTISTVTATVGTGFTGNLKCGLWADNIGSPNNPGAALAVSNVLTNPVTGVNTLTFATPVAVTKGSVYWYAFMHDVTASMVCNVSASSGKSASGQTYATFPTTNPTMVGNTPAQGSTVNIDANNNAEYVGETLEDATTSYVYDSTVGHADFYNIASIASTPVSTIAVTTRGFMQKSDAGTRTAAVQLKSGATTVASSTLSLTTGWQWTWRTDATDPATSAPWTATGVNNAQIGPTVIS